MTNSLPHTPPIVSFYSDYANVTEQNRRPITDILVDIKGGAYREGVESIRAIPYGTPAYKDAKRTANIPGFTTCGAFTRRYAKGLEVASGLIAMDIDQSGNDGVNLKEVAQRLRLDSYTYAIFKSVSGLGYAVIFCIPPTTSKEQFLGSWRALAAYLQGRYGVKADEACKNVDRLRFVSYDPELLLNEGADVFDEIKAEPVKTRAAMSAAPRYVGSGKSFGQFMLDKAVGAIHHAVDGERHAVRTRVAFMLGGLVATGHLDHDTAFGQLYGAFLVAGDGSGQDAARQTIEGQLRQGAGSPWLPSDQERIVYQRRNDGREREEIKALLSLDKPDCAEAIGKAVDKLLDAPEADLLTFWRLESGRSGNVLKLAKTKFRDWLIEQGFYKKPVGTSVELLKVTGPCVRVVTQSEVIDHVTDYIESLPERFDGVSREQLSDLVLGKIRDTFDAVFMASLPVLSQPFLRDTEDTMYCFFANCYTATTAEGTTAQDYATMPGYIWEAQRKPHDFSVVKDGGEFSDYDMFTRNIMAQDPQRLLSLQCALGYLMHGFKTKKNNHSRCVIFYDQFGKTGVADGGTGKGLLAEALENVVMTSKLEGEHFDFANDFRYATIKEGSRVTYFDEWPSHLKFNSLFSEITGSMTINRKHQQQLVIPFEESTKFAICTNNMVLGEGGSHDRRKIEVALCDHYHAKWSPVDDVTNGFFDTSWGAFEWNQFYNLTLGWAQKYLIHGHVTAEVAEGAKRKLMDRTSEKFVEFAEELVAEVGANNEDNLWVKHAASPANVLSVAWAKDAHQAFETQNPGAVRSPNQFNDWMGAYGFDKAKCNSRGERKNQLYFTWSEAA